MIRKVTGIVISTVDYKESSKIVNIFTEDEGIIGVLSKGCKTMKSKLRAVSTPLSQGTFYLRQCGSGMSLLTEVDLEISYKEIRKDIFKQNYALFLLDLASQVYRHGKQKQIYSLLISALAKIEEGYDAEVITDIVELQLLKYLGIQPELSCCVSCGNKEDIITISSYKGGYLCKRCVGGEFVYSLKMIKLIRMLSLVDLDKIKRIDIRDELKKEISIFIDDYYDRYSGLYLKSRDILREFSYLK